MADTLSIAIAQLNPVIGDLAGNARRVRQARAQAAEQGADILVTPEMFLTAYMRDDLVDRAGFIDHAMAVTEVLAKDTADGGPAVLLGTPWRQDGTLYNAVAVLDGGEIRALRFKHHLPNYGVFDDRRNFAAAPLQGPVSLRGARLGIMVCEDMWFGDVAETLAESGAEILIVTNGSPYEDEKNDERLQLAVRRVVETGLPLIYANQVGGQDEILFDGASFILNGDRRLAAQLPSFDEAMSVTEWSNETSAWRCRLGAISRPPERLDALYRALVLGVRDYVNNNGFPGVVIGLSGGIDSALTAAIAVDALGADRVHTILLPSPYTSPESNEDALACAEMLGCRVDTVPIEAPMQAVNAALADLFAGREPDIAEENIQSRLRGTILMAVSNKLGSMLLTTGNKSEMAVGYATLYGDMNGGFNALKDVYKTDVFRLSQWRNTRLPAGALGPNGSVMPERVITKPPSAELRPDQKDEDSLPPYELLDTLLYAVIEAEMSADELIAQGHDRETVLRICRLVDRAEYKRRQAPPGIKVSRRAFGRDRRYPITNRYDAGQNVEALLTTDGSHAIKAAE